MRGVRLSKLSALGLALSSFAPAAVHAGTAQTSFQVTATVVAACSISADDLSFGSYTATNSSPAQASTNVSVTCSDGASYSIGLDAGAGTGASTAVRRMMNGESTLDYTLYQDAAFGQVWGTGDDARSGVGNGAEQSYVVHGRILAGQFVATGAYVDTINVVVTF